MLPRRWRQPVAMPSSASMPVHLSWNNQLYRWIFIKVTLSGAKFAVIFQNIILTAAPYWLWKTDFLTEPWIVLPLTQKFLSCRANNYLHLFLDDTGNRKLYRMGIHLQTTHPKVEVTSQLLTSSFGCLVRKWISNIMLIIYSPVNLLIMMTFNVTFKRFRPTVSDISLWKFGSHSHNNTW